MGVVQPSCSLSLSSFSLASLHQMLGTKLGFCGIFDIGVPWNLSCLKIENEVEREHLDELVNDGSQVQDHCSTRSR